MVVRSELRRSSRYAGSPGGEPMPKRHIVQLTDDQREALVRREHGPPTRRRRNRVQILLRHDGGGTDEQIADELGICVGTVTNVRRRSTLGGVEAALDEKPRPGSRPAARRQGRGDRHHRAVQALGEQLLLAVDPCPARLLLVSESRLASASQDCSQSRFEQRKDLSQENRPKSRSSIQAVEIVDWGTALKTGGFAACRVIDHFEWRSRGRGFKSCRPEMSDFRALVLGYHESRPSPSPTRMGAFFPPHQLARTGRRVQAGSGLGSCWRSLRES